MHLSFYKWKVGFYWAVKLEWSQLPIVYMRSFLVPRPAAVGDVVQQKNVVADKYNPSVLKFYVT